MEEPMPRIAQSFLVAGLVLLGACEPQDRTPGQWLSGDVVAEPVTDWAFTRDHQEVFLETNTWYGVPHSVTVVMVEQGGAIYIPSIYMEEATWPDGKFWNRNVASDPNVRLKIGDKIYERRLEFVGTGDERQAALGAFREKFPFWDNLLKDGEPELPVLNILRLDQRP
jgi:hypothetical protein